MYLVYTYHVFLYMCLHVFVCVMIFHILSPVGNQLFGERLLWFDCSSPPGDARDDYWHRRPHRHHHLHNFHHQLFCCSMMTTVVTEEEGWRQRWCRQRKGSRRRRWHEEDDDEEEDDHEEDEDKGEDDHEEPRPRCSPHLCLNLPRAPATSSETLLVINIS